MDILLKIQGVYYSQSVVLVPVIESFLMETCLKKGVYLSSCVTPTYPTIQK